MTDYYVNPDETFNGDGTTTGSATSNGATGAWNSLQAAIDGNGGNQASAGDTIYCKAEDGSTADETLTAQIDVDGNQGTTTTGHVHFIGVNSSWGNDGTQYVIDGNSAVNTCVDFILTTSYYHIWENFLCKNATGPAWAVDTSGGGFVQFLRIAGIDSLYGGTFRRNSAGSLILSRFSGNTGDGIYRGNNGITIFCCIRDNGGDGYDGEYGYGKLLFGNLIFDNTLWGITETLLTTVMNNVIDNNGSGGMNKVSGSPPHIIGNRITNHSSGVGLTFNSSTGFSGWNYFEGNLGDNIQGSTYHKEILVNDESTNLEDQSDTLQGYKSTTEGAENYELDSSPEATGFSVGIEIPTGQ